MKWVLCVVAGYLIGNLQTSVLVSRAMYRDDVRRHGSGNAGTTNMLRVFGIGPGALTFAGDLIKGVAGVALGRLIAGEYGGYVAGLFVVLGHDFPALFGFRGGKGVASTLGIAWAISPIIAAATSVLTFGVIFITKTVSLGSLLGALLFFVLLLIFEWGNTFKLIFAAALIVLILIRHMENIRRLVKGDEAKLFQTKKKREEQEKNNMK